MTRQQVIERYCLLSKKVATDVFRFTVPADCFCGDNKFAAENPAYYQYSEDVIRFIEDAVNEKLNNVPIDAPKESQSPGD